MLIQQGSASLVIHLAKIAMMGVQAHAQNAEPKMTISCYFCTRVNARLLVQVVSMETQVARSVNHAMPLVEAVLVLLHLSAHLVVREGFFLAALLAHVYQIALKVLLVLALCIWYVSSLVLSNVFFSSNNFSLFFKTPCMLQSNLCSAVTLYYAVSCDLF